MTSHVILRLKGEADTYMVDLTAGVVSRVEPGRDVEATPGQEFRGVEMAVAAERRDATATFPIFTD